MEGLVYLLCAATALACALLLFRGYFGSRARLLLWCGLCFLAFTVENIFLFVDLIIFPDIDLSLAHTAAGLVGALLLVYGLVWEVK